MCREDKNDWHSPAPVPSVDHVALPAVGAARHVLELTHVCSVNTLGVESVSAVPAGDQAGAIQSNFHGMRAVLQKAAWATKDFRGFDYIWTSGGIQSTVHSFQDHCCGTAG